MLGKCLEVPGRGTIDIMRKTKRQCACMCNDLRGTFCVDEEVFLLLCTEGSFVLLLAGDMATVVDIRSHVPT